MPEKPDEVRQLKYAYYPGCTAHTTSVEFTLSVEEICRELGIQFEEIPDWICCGASSGHIISNELAVALPSHNLAQAGKMGLDIVSACPGCTARQKAAERILETDPQMKSKVESDIGANLDLSHRTKHILEVLYNEVGLEALKAKVQKPLEGLKIVAYYGCYLVRPPETVCFDDPENPVIMDEIMQAMGAEVLDWSFKVECCGGAFSIASPDIVKKLSGRIVNAAAEAGADAIVTSCGICQANLDMRQPEGPDAPRLPVLYFSELVALAFGSNRVKEYLSKHLIDAAPLLEKLNLL